MWMAYIGGYNPVVAFDKDEEKAKEKVVRAKHDRYFEDLDVWDWNWENVTEFYGGYTQKINVDEPIWL